MENKNTGYIHRYVKTTLLSVVIGDMVLIGLMLLSALIISKVDMPTFVIDSMIIICSIISGFIAGMVNGKLSQEKGLIMGALTGAIVVVMIMILNATLFSILFTPLVIINFVLIILSSSVGGIIGVNVKQRYRR